MCIRDRLYAERKLKQTLEAASTRLRPEALVTEVGRTARQAATRTGGRVREAVSTGRSAMHQREQQLWADLAASGAVATSDGAGTVEVVAPPEAVGVPAVPIEPSVPHVPRTRVRRPGRRFPSHLGK